MLSELEADHLCWLGERLPGFCGRGYRSLKLSQHCGLVNLGERVLEILPKVGEHANAPQSRGVLLRLLRLSPDFPLQQQSAAGQTDRSSTLLDVFIRAFFEEVAGLMKGGLLRRYLELEEDCVTIRGTILVHRQLTTFANRTDRVACRYDDLTADNRWNRIIKAALRAVRPWIHAVDLQRSWIELMAGFDDVSDVSAPRHLLEGLHYDRHGSRYRPAIGWVERILNLLSPELRVGEKTAPGLLFDMNRLFESAVEQRMQSWAFDRGWSMETQNSTRHLSEVLSEPRRKAFKVRPDLLFTHRGEIAAIADAKWKQPALSKRGFIFPDQADLYQLHAYATVFDCEHLALIYPWSEGLAESHETIFELPSAGDRKTKVSVLCLDVGNDELPLRINPAHTTWSKNHLD